MKNIVAKERKSTSTKEDRRTCTSKININDKTVGTDD